MRKIIKFFSVFLMLSYSSSLISMAICMQKEKRKEVARDSFLVSTPLYLQEERRREDSCWLVRTKVKVKTIFDAVRENNHEQVASMLYFHMSPYHNPEYGEQYDKGKTLLHLAAEYGDVRMMAMLLPGLRDLVNAQTQSYTRIDSLGSVRCTRETPLIIAARLGKRDVVNLLIENGACLDIGDTYGDTAVHKALLSGYRDVVEILMQSGASSEIRNCSGITPVALALRDDGGMQRVFLGLDKDSYNAEKSLLIRLIKEGSLDKVKEHLSKVDIAQILKLHSSTGLTVFDYAVLYNNFAAADYLLEHGADIHAYSPDGLAVLHRASCAGNVRAIQYLLDKNADVNMRAGHHDYRGMIPLQVAIAAKNSAVAKVFLNHPTMSNVLHDDCFNALTLAIEYNMPEVVQELLNMHVYPCEDMCESDKRDFLDNANSI